MTTERRRGRAPYSAPVLRNHGTVAEMTQENVGGTDLDNAGYVSSSPAPTS